MRPRLTRPTTLVLLALSRGVRHGFDILDDTELESGTVYPILRRLEDAGCVRSHWEPAERRHTRSVRHLFLVTRLPAPPTPATRNPRPATRDPQHLRLRFLQREIKITPDAHLALHPDPATVRLDYPLGDGETESEPPPVVAPTLPEMTEHVR